MLDIVVVANKKRAPLTVTFLREIPHTVSWTPDFPFVRRYVPAPDYCELNIGNHIGPFRCFRGHQEALKKVGGPNVLVFEDDAVLDSPDWLNIAQKCCGLLDQYEIVSLHGRDIVVQEEFEWEGMKFILPGSPPPSKLRWCLGSLAYLCSRAVADKITRLQYKGLPMDLLIATNFKFCCLTPSPFLHDRSKGSLVEKAR